MRVAWRGSSQTGIEKSRPESIPPINNCRISISSFVYRFTFLKPHFWEFSISGWFILFIISATLSLFSHWIGHSSFQRIKAERQICYSVHIESCGMAIFVTHGIIKEMNTLNTRNEILLRNIYRRCSGKEISGDSSEQEQFIFISTNLSEFMLIVRPKMTENDQELSKLKLWNYFVFHFAFIFIFFSRTEGTELIKFRLRTIPSGMKNCSGRIFAVTSTSHSKIYETLNGILKSNSFLICLNRNGFFVYGWPVDAVKFKICFIRVSLLRRIQSHHKRPNFPIDFSKFITSIH